MVNTYKGHERNGASRANDAESPRNGGNSTRRIEGVRVLYIDEGNASKEAERLLREQHFEFASMLVPEHRRSRDADVPQPPALVTIHGVFRGYEEIKRYTEHSYYREQPKEEPA